MAPDSAQARLARLLAVTVEGLWEYDVDRRHLFCSARLSELLGLPADGSPMPRQLWRLLGREPRQRIQRALRSAWQEGGSVDELFHIRADVGRKRWFRLRAQVLSGGHFLAGSVGEISSEIEATREHLQHRTFMDSLVDSFPMPVSVKDEQGVVVLANEAFSRMLGLAAGAAEGRRAAQILPAGVSERFNALDRIVFETGLPQTLEDWFELAPGGARRFLHLTKSLSIEANGRRVVVSVYEDQTTVREYANRMRELSMHVEAFIQRLLHTLPHPVYMKDADSRYLMVNDAFAGQWGINAEEIIGRTSRELFGAERGELIEAEDRRVLAGERVDKEDSVVGLRSGNVRRWRVTKSVCHDVDGQVVILGSNFEITDRYHSELELREALCHQTQLRDFLQQIFDALPEPIFVKDASHHYVVVNQALATLLGAEPAAILGRRTAAFLPPELSEQLESVEAETLSGGESASTNSVFVLNSGNAGNRHLRLVCRACKGMDGAPLTVGVFVDITQSLAHEQRLQRINRFMLDVFDAIPNPVAVKNRQHVYVMVNRALAEAHGMSPQEMVGHSTWDFNSPDLAAETIRTDEELFRIGPGVTTEREIPQWYADGREHRILLRKVVCLDPDGGQLIIASNSDVTALRETEIHLRRALDRLDTLVRNAPIGIGLCDAQGAFLQFNPLLLELLGAQKNEPEEASCPALPRLQDMMDIGTDMDVLRVHGVLQPVERRFRRMDGGVLHALFSAVLLSAEEEACWVLIVDQHERLEAEAELRLHRDQLRELVTEQTAGLLRAKEEAERANAAKSDFLAHVSHELRTPLHAMLGFSRLGAERCEKLSPDRLHHYFDRVTDSGERLLDLLDALLDLTKLEAGRMHLELRPAALTAVLEDTSREFDALFAAHALRLHKRFAEDLPPIALDATRMGQVVRNLLSNAAKFAPAGSCITIACQCKSASSVSFVVSDEGPGIPPGELDSVFDKFAQSSRTRSDSGGTGLGLAICREIVLAHQGHISAHNRAGGGCEVVVVLPRTRDALLSAGRDEEKT